MALEQAPAIILPAKRGKPQETLDELLKIAAFEVAYGGTGSAAALEKTINSLFASGARIDARRHEPDPVGGHLRAQKIA